jgi:hypothetical protein
MATGWKEQTRTNRLVRHFFRSLKKDIKGVVLMCAFRLSLTNTVKYLLFFAFLTLLASVELSAAETSPSASQPEWRYSVRPGDNLIHFGRRHLINPDDWKVLQKLNQIKNPYRMQLGQILRVPLHLVKQTPAPAEVALTTGKAGILKADKSVQAVSVGQQLTAGTELITGENSKLNIKFADGSIASMQPNSTLKLDTLSMYSGGGMVDTKLRLQQGKVETEANPKHLQGNQMQIITPTAVAAVRGTKFRVSTDETTIRQETLEGKVALSAAGEEVAVDKGFGSLSEGGKPPLPPVVLLPAPATEGLATKLDALPVTFNMAAQEGAVAWLGKVSTDAQFNSIAATSLSKGTTLSFNDIPDGKYYLKVSAQDKLGLEGYDATHEFSLHARPFAPVAITPGPAVVIREPNPDFLWTKIEQANAYLLEIAKDAEFKQVIDSRRVESNVYKAEKDLQPGQYYWRLASLDEANQGPYALANNFTYKAKPNAPDINQLKVKVERNRVFVSTIDPPQGLVYGVTLHNEVNAQKNVWQGAGLNGEFNFLLKEYGKQTLLLRLIDSDGVAGPEAIVEFDAPPQ